MLIISKSNSLNGHNSLVLPLSEIKELLELRLDENTPSENNKEAQENYRMSLTISKIWNILKNTLIELIDSCFGVKVKR